MTQNFVHLKAHSEYSISDGLLRIKPWLQQIAYLAMPAVALTDHSNLFGLIKFYQQAIALGIKPIVGADIVLVNDNQQSLVTLLCQNQKGYQHLKELLSQGYLQGQNAKGEPQILWEWLKEANEGLIVLSGGRAGDVGQALLAGSEDQARKCLKRWLEFFPDRFYLELQRTGRAGEEDYISAALNLAHDCQVPIVATNDIRFLHQDDFEAHEARFCINNGYILNDAKRPHLYNEYQYVRSAAEMAELFADLPEALENTIAIAQRCNVQLTLGESYLPQFPIPANISLEVYFEQQAKTGLDERFATGTITSQFSRDHYESRLQTELDVINRMGFAGYFLIVADFIRWAKEQQIPVGPGRGSGAGSLVAYALGITGLDPLQHDLLFERFLNPERVSMPDFDIDFCMEQRDRVIDYVAERYGHKAVGQIITYGTMAAKAVVRDVGRVLGMPYGFVDKIAKLIPFELGMTLGKALEQEEELARRYQQEEEVTTLINLAKKLEGITRNAGKHAGGVVIAPTQLTDFVPLYCEAGGNHVITQFDKDDVEKIGLVKFDFLGLRTLTIINWTLKTINQKLQLQNQELLDIEKIPLDDEHTFQLLQKCQTTAVFQLESRGMKELIRRLRPDVFDEIVALVALFRPGPLQSGMVDDFIARKHGIASVVYSHPDLEPILRSTYGVILYQEQVMQIAQVLAGYSLGSADLLRRAMGKKKPEEMAKQRQFFLSGALQRQIPQKIAEHIFDLMEKFAGYGFNKSHSAAYALIAYQTAWLKAHYPAEFMAAVLSADMDNTDKVVALLQECKNMGVIVKPPNLNIGYYHFTVNKEQQIEYGLGAIKGVGQAFVEQLCLERNNKIYSNLFDFCQRLGGRKLSRRVLEPLICSGAMDVFEQHRASLMASIDKALKAADKKNRDSALGQFDLFMTAEETTHFEYVQIKPWSDLERLVGEKETIGFYLSGHPLDSYAQELKCLTNVEIAKLINMTQQIVTIAGVLLSIRVIITKRGTRMAILLIEDHSGKIEITLFPQLYEQVKSQLHSDFVYIIRGKVEDDQYSGGVRMVADAIDDLKLVRAQRARSLILKVENQQVAQSVVDRLPAMVKSYRGGPCRVVVEYQSEQAGAQLALGDTWRIQLVDELLTQLKESYGHEKVLVEY